MSHDAEHRRANRYPVPHQRHSTQPPSRKQAAHNRKRISRSDPLVLHIDPFVQHPNPLGCHPIYVNGKERPGSWQDVKTKRHFPVPIQPFFYGDGIDLGLIHCHSNQLEDAMRESARDSITSAITSAGRVDRVSTAFPLPVKDPWPNSYPSRVKKSDSTPNILFKTTVDTVVRPLFSLAKAHSTTGIDVAMKSYPKHERHQNRKEDEILYLSSSKVNHRTFGRIIDSEAPNGKIPSCSGLPRGWTEEHDRFIAYLATHGPLNDDGDKEKWTPEFHTTLEIAFLVKQRFEKFTLHKIPEWAIEKRLDILELLDNDYFNQEYGCYRFFEWGNSL